MRNRSLILRFVVVIVLTLLLIGSIVMGVTAWQKKGAAKPAPTPMPALVVHTVTRQPSATPTSKPPEPTATPTPTLRVVTVTASATPEVETPESALAATGTPVPEQSVAQNIAIVTAGALNVRLGPSIDYGILSTVNFGSGLIVLGQDASGTWLQVRLTNGIVGWVKRSYTNFGGTVPVVTAPAAPTSTPAAPTAGIWRGEYYANRLLWGSAALVRNDAAIDFNWAARSPAAEVPDDYFSVRWTGDALFDGGQYRFSALVDDGVRVYVDGALVVDSWRDGSVRTVTGERSLGAGRHAIRVEYYENTGAAIIRVWWDKIAGATPTSSGGTSGQQPVVYPAWRGQYWSNPRMDGYPALIRSDDYLDFDWGNGSPGRGVPADNFSARWTRTRNFEAGTYRVHLLVDDGGRLIVDGKVIINEWRDGSAREATAEIVMSKGKHDVEVQYYDRTGNARARLLWEKISGVSYPDWKGEYWANRQLRGEPVLVRNDRDVNFDWRSGSPAYRVPDDYFSARWTRDLVFSPGVYRFYVHADDGIRLFIDGSLVLNEWHDAVPSGEYSAERPLSGSHRIVVEYYERTGAARAYLRWQKVRALPVSAPDATPTPTLRPTNTPAPTATLAPTNTPTPVPTNTPEPTATPTVGPAPTAEPVETPTPTPTPTLVLPEWPRSLRVVLQQGVAGYEGTTDTWISAWESDTNSGAKAGLRVRQAGIESTLIRFDLAGVFASPSVDVHYADLTLHALSRSNDNPMRMVAHQVLRPWSELEATWINSSSGDQWAEPGCYASGIDVAAAALHSVSVEQVLDDVAIDLTEAVHAWAQDPGSNYGVVLRGEGPVGVMYNLASSEHTPIAQRPVLRIIYSVRTTAAEEESGAPPRGSSLLGGVVQ